MHPGHFNFGFRAQGWYDAGFWPARKAPHNGGTAEPQSKKEKR
jgi:hypothetical protein